MKKWIAAAGLALATSAWGQAGPLDQLSKAIGQADSKAVGALVAAGTPVKGVDSTGFAPLVSAVMVGAAPARKTEAMAMVRVLLDAGADIEQEGPVGATPLMAASGQHHSPEMVELLLARGADVNRRGYNDTTPLYHAVRKGQAAIAEVLVRHGADVKAGNAEGQTPLHYAALHNMASTVTLLLARGADINARDNEGKTALAWALGKTPASFIGTAPPVPPMVTLLRERGATE